MASLNKKSALYAGVKLNNLLLFSCLFFVSCSNSSSDGDSTIPDVDGDVSIAQGVYGQVLFEDDVGDPPETGVLQGFTVQIFFEAPHPSANPETVVPLIATETNEKGFYEIPLQKDDYCICTGFLRCGNFILAEGEVKRIDYTFGLPSGWHLENIGCE